jgi:dihydrofolate reductase
MQVAIYIAASLEGYIADAKGGTDWVADDELFEQIARTYGCICMGRNTYDEYGGPAFDGLQHIVLTKRLPKKTTFDNVHFASSPQEAIKLAKNLGFKKLLVIGGARTNQAFMQAGVVKKVYADIHPFLLKKGIPMFGDYQAKFDFKMQSSKWYDQGFTHAVYTLGKAHEALVAIIMRDESGAYFVSRQPADATWHLGASALIGDIETPHHAAARILRDGFGIKKAPSPCFEFDEESRDVPCTVHVFEMFIKNRKKVQNKQGWSDAAWLAAEDVNELVSDGLVPPLTAALYQKYRTKM